MEAVRDTNGLRSLTEAPAAEPDVLLAIAFGSLVQGSAGFESEADVAVLAERPLDLERRVALMRVVAKATGRPVDLLDRAARDRLTCNMLADVEDFLPLRERLLRERRQRWIG